MGDEATSAAEPDDDSVSRRSRAAGAGVRARRVASVAAVLALAFLPPDVTEPELTREPLSDPAASGTATSVGTSPEPPRLPDTTPHGWVIDGVGTPVAGVEIRVRVDGALLAVTDASGGFRAHGLDESGTFTLDFSGDSIFPAEARWQRPGPQIRVLVTRRHQIDGVVQADGEPVAGAQVVLRDGSGLATRHVATDASGGFYFDDLLPGVYELWAYSTTHASPALGVTRYGPGPFAPIDIQLEPATVVRGRVIDHHDRSGISASLVLASDIGTQPDRIATSDANGYFRFDGVLPGRFRVEADAAGYVALADYVVKAEARQAETEIEVRLRRGGVAVGQVLDARGDPLARAQLIVSRRDKKAGHAENALARAQRDRRFGKERGDPHEPLVRWVHPLAGKKRTLPDNRARIFGAARKGKRPVECGRGHCGVDLGRVRGTVVHAASDGVVVRVTRVSRSIAGRYVFVQHRGGITTRYLHLHDIREDLVEGEEIRAGEPLGTIGSTGARLDNPHLHLAMSQRHAGRVWFIDPEPMLRHAVVLPESASLEGFAHQKTVDEAGVATLVASSPAGQSAAKPPRPSADQVEARFASDEDGRFRIDGLTSGRYVVWAFHPEHASGSSAPFRVAAGRETAGIVVRLNPGVVVFGRVTGEHGGLAFARVVAEAGKGEDARTVAEAMCDVTGRYELAPVFARVSLQVSASGHSPIERVVMLDNRGADVIRREESFSLAVANARLHGRVNDPDGFPLRGARVIIAGGPAARGQEMLTDAYGNFSFDALAKGEYTVRVASTGYPSATAKARTDEIALLSVLQGGGVRVVVRDGRGRAPLVGVRVQATGPAGAKRAALTDREGGVELVPLLPGRWTLRVRVAGYVLARKEIDVSAGRGPGAVTADRVLVELFEGATLAGVVRDRNGDRVAGAKVASGGVTATTDQHGRFRLVDVPSGEVVVSATRADERGSIEINLAPRDELVTLEIKLE